MTIVYYFPLIDFSWDGEEYSITDSLKIMKEPYDMEHAKRVALLSEGRRQQLKRVPYWIVVNDQVISHEDASIMVNTLLLAFWIVGPVHTTTWMKFLDYREMIVMFEHYKCNLKEDSVRVDNHLLESVASVYVKLMRITKRNRRLHTALVNTFSGCVVGSWKVAFVCFSTAVEAMLAYGKYNISRKLGMAYACLTESRMRKRNKAYREFKNLYRVRSKIVHGVARGWKNEDRNLRRLAEYGNMLRKLWMKVFENVQLRNALEKGDVSRTKYLGNFTKGYKPPF